MKDSKETLSILLEIHSDTKLLKQQNEHLKEKVQSVIDDVSDIKKDMKETRERLSTMETTEKVRNKFFKWIAPDMKSLAWLALLLQAGVFIANKLKVF
jgi:regulator of replication initiation timing